MSNKDVGIMYAFVLDMPEAGNRERREKYTNAGNRKSHKKKIISGRKKFYHKYWKMEPLSTSSCFYGAIGTFTGSKAKTSRGEVQLQTPRSALLGLFVRITISFNILTLSLTDIKMIMCFITFWQYPPARSAAHPPSSAGKVGSGMRPLPGW